MQSSIGSFIYSFPSSTFLDACFLIFLYSSIAMKQQIVLLFSVLLLSFFFGSSRLLVPTNSPRQGEKELKATVDNTVAQSSFEWKDDMEELMGSVECYEKDDECSSRRMIAEAHLDYIYTQHRKP